VGPLNLVGQTVSAIQNMSLHGRESDD